MLTRRILVFLVGIQEEHKNARSQRHAMSLTPRIPVFLLDIPIYIRSRGRTEEAHNDIEEANRQLAESERLQRKARKKQILLAIIAIIAVIIFILVIVHEVNGL